MNAPVESGEAESSTVLVGIMHLAKGLEFRILVLMACDEKVLPWPMPPPNLPDLRET